MRIAQRFGLIDEFLARRVGPVEWNEIGCHGCGERALQIVSKPRLRLAKLAVSVARESATSGAWRELGNVRLPDEILAVCGMFQRLGKPQQLFGIDEALGEGDLLGTGDLQALTFLNDVDELRCLQQRFMRAGIEPRVAASGRVSAFSSPRSRYHWFRSVISSSPRADGFISRTTSVTRPS